MAEIPNVNREAVAFARNASRELAQLQKAMKSAGDTMAGLSRAIKAPVPQGGSRTIKGSRSKPGLLESAAMASIGGFLGGAISNSLSLGSGGSFYASQSQIGSQYLTMTTLGQRNS